MYTVRDGDNEELRYSLRSLANLPHRNVWIIGAGPDWLTGVNRIHRPQTGSRYQNVTDNLRAAIRHPDVSDPFIVFNDDFFVMQPLTELPTLHCGPLAGRLVAEPSGYEHKITRTYDLLRSLGVAEPLCYDMHSPRLVTKAGLAEALDAGDEILFLTVYGNLQRIGGTRGLNAKVRMADQVKHGPFLSTSDESFRVGNPGRIIREAFPAPSEYEAR